MKNKDKFSLKEAFEVIAKHMQSLVKDELKKSDNECDKHDCRKFKVDDSHYHVVKNPHGFAASLVSNKDGKPGAPVSIPSDVKTHEEAQKHVEKEHAIIRAKGNK